MCVVPGPSYHRTKYFKGHPQLPTSLAERNLFVYGWVGKPVSFKKSMFTARTHAHASLDGGTVRAAVVKTLSSLANAEPILRPKFLIHAHT